MNDGRKMTHEVMWPKSGKRMGLTASVLGCMWRGVFLAGMFTCLFSHAQAVWAQKVNPDGNGGGGGTVPVLGLSSSGSPSTYGNSVTFTASLTPSSCATSGGSANFYDNGTLIGTVKWTVGSTAKAALATAALTAGSHTIMASSPYPGNTSCVAPATTSITQTVSAASPSITVASSANPSNYGAAVTFTATVPSGDTNLVTFHSGATALGTATPSSGKATLSTTSLAPGSSSITAAIAAGGNYAANTSSAITQTVNKATVTVSAWPAASAITYGQTLASSTLSGGTASVSGTFAWTTPSTSPGAGTSSEGVTFTPSNTTDYNSVTGAVNVTVNKATPVLSWATPSPITSTTALSATQLDATSSIAGTFSYSPAAGTVLAAGSHVLTATFTPSSGNAANFNTATATVTLTVTQAITWDNGTVTLNISNSSGSVFSSSTSYGQGATASSVAEALASSNANVRVTAVNDILFIEAAGAGASTDYSYTTSSTWNTAVFAQPSFTGSPASGSLSGGANASTGSQTQVYAYSITTPAGGSGYDQVGNVVNYTDSVMGTWTTASAIQSCATNINQQSGYDCLNRLTTLQNTATTSTSTQFAGAYYCWSYDAFGNRTAQGLQTTPCPAPSSLQATARYNANNQVTWTSVNAAANGFSYDAAGNVVNDNLNQYLYDGEGRVCAVANTPAPGLTTMTGYVYDPDGNRVAKGTITTWSCDPSVNGLTTAENETEYILGLDGQPVTEMAQDANGSMQWQRSYVYAGGALIGTFDPSPNPAGQSSPAVPILSFRLTDWQGTLRATTDASGVSQGTCISLPFGDELTCQGNIPDGHHFTGKERDQESGNDYFGARYYTSNMGRFLTPDWAAKPITVPYASFGDPQTLNLYSYVENGPLNRVDAEGHATDQEGTSTQPVNLGGRCASFSKPDPDCSISSLADVAEVSADEAAYNAQVRQAFASTGNMVAQQQSSSTGGFWGWLTSLFSKTSTADQAAALRTYYAGETYFDANGNPIEISKLSDAQIIQFNKDHRSEFAAGGWAAAAIGGLPAGAVKLRGNQGYRDGDGNIWKKDQLHKDHWDVSDRNGNKIKEVDFEGNQIWPNGPKNKNK